MKSERLYAAIGAADDELLTRCESATKKTTWVKFGSLAACAAAVLVFCVWAIPGLLNSPTTDNPNFTYDPNNTALIGLPPRDFNLAELHNSSGVEMDRIVRMRTTDFFSDFPPDMMVFVRVLNTEQWVYKDRHTVYTSEKQTSMAHILSIVWSGVTVPEIISIEQSKYGGCCEGEETNLLREGGVYMLPLRYWEDSDVWIIDGDLDVLFEVDDQGRIWTHSTFEGFNRYDGENASALIDSITVLTSDENFAAAITMFGRITNNWGILTDVTILSVNRTVDTYGYDQIEYRMSVNGVLSSAAPNQWYTWQPEIGGEIIAVSHGDAAYLEQDKRYLIHLDPSDGGPFIEEMRAAEINADDTITAIPLTDRNTWHENIFSQFNGYTLEQMQEEAERAKMWHERYSN